MSTSNKDAGKAAGRRLLGLLEGLGDTCRLEESPEVVGASGLYSLIDGGAEVYLAMGIVAACSARLVCPGAPEVVVDLYDMGRPTGAFAAYHHDMREGRAVEIGQEAEYDEGVLQFWRDRYYVSVVPLGRGRRLERLVLGLGGKISAAIGRDGTPPELVRMLPEKNLDRRRVHYFFGPRLLERHLPFEGENPLGIDTDTEGVVAHYRPETVLLLVEFRNPCRARRAKERLEGSAARAGGPLAAVLIKGRLLAAAFGRPAGAARKLASDALEGAREEPCREERR